MKPQNLLLVDKLTIKLADFGAATIAKHTGATTLTIENTGNTQHNPYYTAPEYLNRQTKEKTCSMDVYSYGMIGYEIITRTAVFSKCPNINLVMYKIQREGLKPDAARFDKIGRSLEDNPKELSTFRKLQEIVYQC